MLRYFFFRGLKSMMTGFSSASFRIASPIVRQGRSLRCAELLNRSVCNEDAFTSGPCVGSGKSTETLNLFPMNRALSLNHVISYKRMKTDTVAIMRFDEDMAEILRDLPGSGPLFPYLRTVRAGDRATEFKQRCDGLGIKGVSLHSYRYAWAERAKTAGYPERYAQVNLGHNSKAMTRAYSRKAEVEMPSLSEYERMRAKFAEMSKTVEPVMASA